MPADLPKLTAAQARKLLAAGATYNPADRTHDRVILRRDGWPVGWLARRGREKDEFVFYDFEVEVDPENLSLDFPPGMPRPAMAPGKRMPPLARVHPHVPDMRRKANLLLDQYAIWLDPEFGTPPKNSFGLVFDEHDEPRFGFSPKIDTSAVKHDPETGDTYPLILGWSKAYFLMKGGKKRQVPALYFALRAGKKPKPGSPDKQVDLEPGTDIRVTKSGAWELTAAGRAKGAKDEDVLAVVPQIQDGVNFHVGTSKMGCASWNLPAGPGGQGILGSCAAAAPIMLNELNTAATPEQREKSAEIRRSAAGGIWGLIGDLEKKLPPGFTTHVGKYEDLDAWGYISPQDKGTPAPQLKLICTLCYALKGNYTHLNQQFYMATRWRWADKACKHDRSGQELAGNLTAEQAGRSSFFAYAMTEAIRRYYAPQNLARRAVYAEDPRFYRIHDSGDFFNHRYLWAWIQVAENLPQIKFWAPTRQWMFNGYLETFNRAPVNFLIRPSAMQVDDDAPKLPGMAAGSTVTPAKHGVHFECPATRNDRGSCIGGLAVMREMGFNSEHAGLIPADESSCRMCWGLGPRQPTHKQALARLVPISYHSH